MLLTPALSSHTDTAQGRERGLSYLLQSLYHLWPKGRFHAQKGFIIGAGVNNLIIPPTIDSSSPPTTYVIMSISDQISGLERTTLTTTFVKFVKIFCNLDIEDTADCEGWTWTEEDNELLPLHCLMYSHLGTTIEFPNAIRNGSMRFKVLTNNFII